MEEPREGGTYHPGGLQGMEEPREGGTYHPGRVTGHGGA